MSDFEFMDYETAAKRLGITIASVKRQAARKKWPRRPLNTGGVQVGIPVDRLSADRQGVSHDDSQADMSSAINSAHEQAISALKELIEAERRRADAAESRLDDMASDRNHWRELAMRPWWKRIAG